jgi:hypothetical protein
MSTVTSLNVTILTLLNTHIKCIALLISKFRKNKGNGPHHFIIFICVGHFDDSLLAIHHMYVSLISNFYINQLSINM